MLLAPRDVEIQVRAYSLNFKDIYITLGQIDLGSSMAGEFSGRVIETGSEVSRIRIGDRVCGFGARVYANVIRAPESCISCIPSPTSYTTAASLPVAFCIAYYCLVKIANLREDQAVLIHSAAGGVG